MQDQYTFYISRLTYANNAHSVLPFLKKKLANLDHLINNSSSFGGNAQLKLLEVICQYCHENKIIINQLYAPVHSMENEIEIETNTIIVEGQFYKIVHLIYDLEIQKSLSKVAAVHFLRVKNKTDGKMKLTAKLYLKNAKQH